MIDRYKRVVLCAWIVSLLIMKIPVSAKTVPEELRNLYAQSAVLMDAESGRILFEKNGNQVRAMASTTKVMTLVLALEQADINESVEISSYAASMPDVQLHVQKGEAYRMEDLLYSLMLESHNDAAVAIAEHVAQGSVQSETKAGERSMEESKNLVTEFAGLMNAKALDIGCFNTHFVTPNGLDGEDEGGAHGTTARDLAQILRYCIMLSPKKEEFLKITRTSSHTFGNLKGSRNFTVMNHNAFLSMMDGALTGKTGFTSKAGYCYVGALRRDGKTYIAALLACGWPNHKNYKWSDMKKLMDYGLEEYTYHSFGDVPIPPEALSSIPVEHGKGKDWKEEVRVNLKLTAERKPEEKKCGILLGKDERIEVIYQVEDTLYAPVKAGDVAGYVKYLVNDEVFRTELLFVSESVDRIDYLWCIKQIAGSFFDFNPQYDILEAV